MFWSILWTLAKDRLSLCRSLNSGFLWGGEGGRSIYFSQSYPALPNSLLKLFEIPISLAILYAVARNVCRCREKHVAQRI